MPHTGWRIVHNEVHITGTCIPQILCFQWNIEVWDMTSIFCKEQGGGNRSKRNHAHWRYKLYSTWSDLRRDFTWPFASWNIYANHSSWNITCIFHMHGFLLYYMYTQICPKLEARETDQSVYLEHIRTQYRSIKVKITLAWSACFGPILV